jgi:hypothetical protein
VSSSRENLVLRARRVLSVSVVTALLSVGVAPYAVASEVRHPTTVDAHLDVEVSVSEAEATTQEVPAGPDGRSGPLEAPIAFTGLWAELPDGLDAVTVRTSPDGTAWSGWTELELVDDDDAPDPGTEEAARAEAAPRVSDLLTAEEARYVEVATEAADPGDLKLQFIDTAGLNESLVTRVARHLTPRPVPAEASTVPSWVQPRSAWGAAAYRGTPSAASNGVQQVVLHHTAGNNDLRRADGTCDRNAVAARLRAYQSWHQNGNGWSDLGYNVAIDPCGGVWEGRAGGLDRAIIGAHAANWNTGSVGITVMGNYERLQPNADILRALDRVVGWKAGIHGVNLQSSVTRTISGVSRTAPAVVGHQQVGQTACPGLIMGHLDRIRSNAASQAGQWPRVPDGLGLAAFRDITGSPHALNIETLVERGITSGYQDGTFRPGLAINRAQVAAFLAKALGLDPVPGNRFPDVAPGFVHEGWINALVDAGVLGGYQNGTFRPNEPLRREHMAVVIARALELSPRPSAAAQFSDVTAYAGEIGAIAHAGITSGRPDGTFQPRSPVTRGQMATFLVNAIGVLER